jgi:hypothetical protein
MPGGRPCSICMSAARPRVELGLARGVSAAALGRRFKLSPDSIKRHQRHIPPALMRELQARSLLPARELESLRIEESTSLLEHLVHQRARLYRLVDSCEELGDVRSAFVGHARITANLEQTGKLLDLFAAAATTIHQNLVISPDYLQLRQALLTALKPYPEARAAVVAVLRELEDVQPEPPEEPRKVIALNPPGNGGDLETSR